MSRLYASELHRRRVLGFDPPDEQPIGLDPGGGVAEPAGLVDDGAGTLMVADAGADVLARMDLGAGSWSAIGGTGGGRLEFRRPTAVAIDGFGRAVVADAGNGRIVRFDPAGGGGWEQFGQVGMPTAADPAAVGRFADPRGVAIDGSGRILVADPRAGRVVRMDDIDGSGWTTVGLPAALSPARPFGVAADAARVAIADVAHATVVVLDDNGGLVATLGAAEGLTMPAHVAIDPDGVLAVADIVANSIWRFEPRAGAYGVLDVIHGSSATRPAPTFERLAGITIGRPTA